MEGYCNTICLYLQAKVHPNLQLTLMGMLLTPAELRQMAACAGLDNSTTVPIELIVSHLKESIWNRERMLGIWTRVGNIEQMRPLLCRVHNGISIAFLEAARVGQVEVLEAMYPLHHPNRLGTYHQALWSAAEAGRVETVKFFETKFPDLLTDALRLTLAKRALGNNQRALLEYFFPEGTGRTYNIKLLESAFLSGSEELIMYFLRRVSEDDVSSFILNRCFVLSAEKGYLVAMEGLWAQGATNFSGALAAAARAGQVAAARMLLSVAAPVPSQALLAECLYEAIRKSTDLELVRLLVEAGASNFNLGLEAAAESGNLPAAALMLELGATQLEDPFYWAARHGHYELVVLLRQAGASNLEQALGGAAYGGYLRVVKYLLGQEPGLPCEEALSEALDRKSRQNSKVIRCLLKRRPSNVRQIALSLAWNGFKPAVREILDEYIKNEPGEAASSV